MTKRTMRKMTADMTIDEKIAVLLSEPDFALSISIKFWDLFEEFGEKTADEFNQQIYETRGILRRKLTIQEVEEIYEQLRKRKW